MFKVLGGRIMPLMPQPGEDTPSAPSSPSPFLTGSAEPSTDTSVVQAVQIARLYYQQGLTTDAIARELGLSRPRVSRLLTLARRTGLVEIRIHDPQEHPQHLEAGLHAHWPGIRAQVISLPPDAVQATRMERVAQAAAHWLGTHLRPRMTVGIAWGNTLDAVSQALTPRPLPDTNFVQLNGSASAYDFNSGFVADTLLRFARAFGGRAHLFPVPTFFDDPVTRAAMWRERSVRHVLDLQARADVLLYSVGALDPGGRSHAYVAGHVEESDLAALRGQGVVGDIATVFYRADGSFQDVPLNARSSGPDLELTRRAAHAICVVSGLGKVAALRAALRGGLMNTLIVDEVTARELLRA